MNPLVIVVKPRPDRATIEALKELLQDALDGRVTGIAYVALKRDGGYSGDLAGTAKTSPAYALGLLRALENKIAVLIQ